MKTLVLAARLQPAAHRPMLRDAGLLIENDRVLAVGDGDMLRRENPDAILHDLGDVLILPGFVNAHVHLELSNHKHGVAPASFIDWLMDLMGQSLDAAAGVRAGVAECLKFGVTTVGDISRQCKITRPILAAGPLRVVSFGEVQAMAQRRTLLDERFAAATDTSDESATLRVGISPHAPYSIEPEGYIKCREFARKTRRPLATHLAETPEEREFLESHTGPFARLWESLRAWDDQVPKFAGGPIRYAKQLGLLLGPTLLAHVNECDRDELLELTGGRASVVYCPRTHAYFGRPPHRWRDMLACGINVAVGTDSRASSPDLNLLDDLRLLHRIGPEIDVEMLLAMGTRNGAKAILMGGHVGQLIRGAFADFVAWPVGDFLELLESEVRPRAVWIGGAQACSL